MSFKITNVSVFYINSESQTALPNPSDRLPCSSCSKIKIAWGANGLSLSHIPYYITQSTEAEERKKEIRTNRRKRTQTLSMRNPASYSDQILYNILLRSVIIHTSHSVFPPSYSMPGLVQRCCHNVLTTFVFSFVFPANCIFSPASHKCVGSIWTKQTKLVNTRQTLVTTPSLAKESTYQEKWLPGLQSKPS